MDDLPVFAHPQMLAAALGLINLALALSLEAVVLILSLRAARGGQASPMAEEPLPHDFYDWLIE